MLFRPFICIGREADHGPTRFTLARRVGEASTSPTQRRVSRSNTDLRRSRPSLTDRLWPGVYVALRGREPARHTLPTLAPSPRAPTLIGMSFRVLVAGGRSPFVSYAALRG